MDLTLERDEVTGIGDAEIVISDKSGASPVPFNEKITIYSEEIKRMRICDTHERNSWRSLLS